jgi:thioredoxin reductase
MSTTDVLIVGGGPAGLSAALTLVRQNHSVIVFDTQKCRALPSFRLHGVSGSDGQPPANVLAHARKEAAAYKDFIGVNAEIVEIKKVDSVFEAKDSAGTLYRGRRVILANGVRDCFPAIEGYAEAWGKAMYVQLRARRCWLCARC